MCQKVALFSPIERAEQVQSGRATWIHQAEMLCGHVIYARNIRQTASIGRKFRMIRHLSISQSTAGVTDMLRIETYRDGDVAVRLGQEQGNI